jgi:hypothetical protein
MYSQCLIFPIMIILINAKQEKQPIALHIGALFNSDNLSINNGQQDLQAAQMAIDEINFRYEELFDGLYTLTLLANDSRVYLDDFLIIINKYLVFSVIRFMLLMLFFMQYFVGLSYFVLLVHHVQMKQKQSSK